MSFSVFFFSFFGLADFLDSCSSSLALFNILQILMQHFQDAQPWRLGDRQSKQEQGRKKLFGALPLLTVECILVVSVKAQIFNIGGGQLSQTTNAEVKTV